MKVSVPFFLLLLLIPLMGCPHKSAQKVPPSNSPKEISRERAVEIARSHVKFQPKSLSAEKATENGRPVWRVTFRGEPAGQGGVMGEVMIVSLDRFTGEVVSIAQS